ncbi:unnamed protein product [Sphagnum tenellum]
MDTKTFSIDPRFAVRENASIDLQLRAKTKLKRKSKKTTRRLPPVTRDQILRFQPVTKERVPPFQPVIRSPDNTFCIPSGYQGTDSAIPAGDQVTREHILRVSTNQHSCIGGSSQASGHLRTHFADLASHLVNRVPISESLIGHHPVNRECI